MTTHPFVETYITCDSQRWAAARGLELSRQVYSLAKIVQESRKKR
jgi:hypothetical protein